MIFLRYSRTRHAPLVRMKDTDKGELLPGASVDEHLRPSHDYFDNNFLFFIIIFIIITMIIIIIIFVVFFLRGRL